MRENDKYVSAICGQWMDVAVARNVVTINFLAGPSLLPPGAPRLPVSHLIQRSYGCIVGDSEEAKKKPSRGIATAINKVGCKISKRNAGMLLMMKK